MRPTFISGLILSAFTATAPEFPAPAQAQDHSVAAVTPVLAPYPASPQLPVVEHPFGQTINDPWRWLEGDVRTDANVADWVKAQSAFTDNYLKLLPERPVFEKRMRALIDYERFGIPQQRGRQLFYRWNSGLMNQAQLLVANSEAASGSKGRVLLDPASWAKDGATALDAWEPSDNGAVVAYSVQDGGSDRSEERRVGKEC